MLIEKLFSRLAFTCVFISVIGVAAGDVRAQLLSKVDEQASSVSSLQSQKNESDLKNGNVIASQRPVGEPLNEQSLVQSDVFGANLFLGNFSRQEVAQFNPDYAITIGDRIQVRLWGAFDFDQVLVVDPKGNIFVPHAGPVKVLGVRNKDLEKVLESAVARTFRTNVKSYASLAAAQPVRVFVGGFVKRPGLYAGTSLDSLLNYLDQAGGVDPERGSFLKISVKRNSQTRATVNLYDFLLKGVMPLVQLSDGDVIFVEPRGNTVKVSGLVSNPKRFEFNADSIFVSDLIQMAEPKAGATHVRVIRSAGIVRSVEYYALDSAGSVRLDNGDELEFTSDKKPGTITVRVEGEHQSPQEYVLPYGARLRDVLAGVEYSAQADAASLQLFRASVRERQGKMLETALKSLEAAALTARSGTSDEARLRKEEAELILQWVDRAKKVQPSGQVVLANVTPSQMGDIPLENGDVLRIPRRDGLVLVSGEVLFPNAIAFEPQMSVVDYVKKAGGYTQNSNGSRIIVARRDGTFSEFNAETGFFSGAGDQAGIREGDEILVLPKIDVKSRQIWKDLTQIIYQIAVSAKVVFGL